MVTMNILEVTAYIIGAIGFIATMSAALIVVRSSTTKTTISNQKELIETLMQGKDEQKDQIADLQNKHVESVKSVSALQGQVDVLRNIPLKEISTDMKSIAGEMKSLSENQAGILSVLRGGQNVTLIQK